MDWIAFGIEAAAIIFFAGIAWQSIKNNQKRLDAIDRLIAGNRENIETKLSIRSHNMLPECQNEFQMLVAGISELKGKMDVVILMIKNGQK